MKADTIESLAILESRLRTLRSAIKKLTVKQVGKTALRDEAAALADYWVEELRSPLEFRFKLPPDTIAFYAEGFKKLHVLSRPNNQVSSYTRCLDGLLKNFKNDLVLPLQQMPGVTQKEHLREIIDRVPEEDESEYLVEAVACAESGYLRASVVMGWCATIAHIHRKIEAEGLDVFNAASRRLKTQTTGRYKRFSAEYKFTVASELQGVFDNNLLWVVEGIGLIDANQGDRLRSMFTYRNQSAHPGEAPIGEAHIIAFFSDIVEIVLANPAFAVSSRRGNDGRDG